MTTETTFGPTLYIIRGIPGSGKSTFAKRMMETSKFDVKNHFEADMYFVVNGKYLWKKDDLAKAHQWCFDKVEKTLAEGENCIVSNTFITKWSLEPYIKMCQKNNYRYFVIRLETRHDNIHGVPKEVVRQMEQNFEDFPGETIIK